MEHWWIAGAGRVALDLFYVFIVVTLIAAFLRRKTSKRGRFEADRVNRVMGLMLEYLGNVDAKRRDGEWERRRNLQARFLIDHIKEDLARRDVSETDRERILDDLRRSMQPGEPGGRVEG